MADIRVDKRFKTLSEALSFANGCGIADASVLLDNAAFSLKRRRDQTITIYISWEENDVDL